MHDCHRCTTVHECRRTNARNTTTATKWGLRRDAGGFAPAITYNAIAGSPTHTLPCTTASDSVNCPTSLRAACTHHKVNGRTRRIGELPVAARTSGGATSGHRGACLASRQAGRNFGAPATSRGSRRHARCRRCVPTANRTRAHGCDRHGAAVQWDLLNFRRVRENGVDRRELRGRGRADLSVQNNRAAAHTCDLHQGSWVFDE